MSRYAIWTEDDDLEVCTGFEEGLGTFFLTIADARTCTGESGSYLFHNYDHHPGMGMTLEEVAMTLERFGMEAPPDLLLQLTEDAKRSGAETKVPVGAIAASTAVNYPADKRHRVLGWKKAF